MTTEQFDKDPHFTELTERDITCAGDPRIAIERLLDPDWKTTFGAVRQGDMVWTLGLTPHGQVDRNLYGSVKIKWTDLGGFQA